jgi:tRNA(fMet)-specific endonuclease VapC
MNYLIDTDQVIEHLKGKRAIVEQINHYAPDGLAISLITYGEIYEGILFGRNPKQHSQGFVNFLKIPVRILLPSQVIMRRFAQLRGQLRQTGQIIGDFDILIAATALHYDLTLMTHNRKHFSRIPLLKLFE